MGFQQLVNRFGAHAAQHLCILLCRVTADVMIVHEISGSSDQERCRGGTGYGQRIVCCVLADLTVRLHLNTTFSLHPGGNAFLFYPLDGGHKLANGRLAYPINHRSHFGFQLRTEAHAERQCAFLRGFQLNNNDIVGLRGKNGALIANTIFHIRGGGSGLVEV